MVRVREVALYSSLVSCLFASRMSRPPPEKPSPPPPLISLDIIDAPTQRLYLVALLLLVQAYKLSHFLTPSSTPISTNPILDPNWTLYKWIAIDLVAIQVVKRLRIPRLNWSWKARWATAITLILLDYTLFGRWVVCLSLSSRAVNSYRSLKLSSILVYRIHLPSLFNQVTLDSLLLDSREISQVIKSSRKERFTFGRSIYCSYSRSLVSPSLSQTGLY